MLCDVELQKKLVESGKREEKKSKQLSKLAGERELREAELVRLRDCEAKLGEAEANLGESQAKLGESDTKLGESEAKLGGADAKLGWADAAVTRLTAEVAELSVEPEETDASKMKLDDFVGSAERRGALGSPRDGAHT
jgi:chromosome segregation ATPase